MRCAEREIETAKAADCCECPAIVTILHSLPSRFLLISDSYFHLNADDGEIVQIGNSNIFCLFLSVICLHCPLVVECNAMFAV